MSNRVLLRLHFFSPSPSDFALISLGLAGSPSSEGDIKFMLCRGGGALLWSDVEFQFFRVPN